jgi:hypothetical protein
MKPLNSHNLTDWEGRFTPGSSFNIIQAKRNNPTHITIQDKRNQSPLITSQVRKGGSPPLSVNTIHTKKLSQLPSLSGWERRFTPAQASATIQAKRNKSTPITS